jgi:hypothetical protein
MYFHSYITRWNTTVTKLPCNIGMKILIRKKDKIKKKVAIKKKNIR